MSKTVCFSQLLLCGGTALGFPLEVVHMTLDTNSRTEFGYDQRAFNDAITWQTRHIASSATPAPFVGCVDYVLGREAKIRLEKIFGVQSVHTAHHSHEYGLSCFVFHACYDDAKRMLDGDTTGNVTLAHLAAFPSTLKVTSLSFPGNDR